MSGVPSDTIFPKTPSQVRRLGALLGQAVGDLGKKGSGSPTEAFGTLVKDFTEEEARCVVLVSLEIAMTYTLQEGASDEAFEARWKGALKQHLPEEEITKVLEASRVLGGQERRVAAIASFLTHLPWEEVQGVLCAGSDLSRAQAEVEALVRTRPTEAPRVFEAFRHLAPPEALAAFLSSLSEDEEALLGF